MNRASTGPPHYPRVPPGYLAEATARFKPARPTAVFATYWYFAVERQAMFFRRWSGQAAPRTEDAILARYKFTNAYRASDRVSQYLIRSVIYDGPQNPADLFFRILLFKIFNRIGTWRLLENVFGPITWADYAFDRYDSVLTTEIEAGRPLFANAYIMPSGSSGFVEPRKHRNYLRLLEVMMADGVPTRVAEASGLREAYVILRSYPMLGDFLAYQFAIDLNYSALTDFSEMEFVVPGPGARSGIRKCFADLGGLSEEEVVRLMAERVETEVECLGMRFSTLWSRPLQLVDCQNLFCEVDKYARVAHPDVTGGSRRFRIKQAYHPKPDPIDYWYPPKWGLNDAIARSLYG